MAHPGRTRTDLHGRLLDPVNGATIAAMVESSPLRRVGTPADIAAVTDFLLGDDAGHLTGTDLLVDGGILAALTTGHVATPA
ncbi:SDR family oxidoreductase [Nocardia bovistercoris]|uniref:SDR family oxidoreductase n=1 Tax=Nocardia bovistercoris TaxID=2785916 RepID=UPI002FCD69F4